MTRRFADAGYAAFAPYVFERDGAAPAPLTAERMGLLRGFFDEMPAAAWQDTAQRDALIAAKPADVGAKIKESMGALWGIVGNLDASVPCVAAAATYLRTELDVTRGQKIGAVGFCMGGGLAARLAAVDAELAGAVIFYGQSPSAEQAAQIRCPLLGHYAASDAPLNAGLPAFAAALKAPFEHFITRGRPTRSSTTSGRRTTSARRGCRWRGRSRSSRSTSANAPLAVIEWGAYGGRNSPRFEACGATPQAERSRLEDWLACHSLQVSGALVGG